MYTSPGSRPNQRTCCFEGRITSIAAARVCLAVLAAMPLAVAGASPPSVPEETVLLRVNDAFRTYLVNGSDLGALCPVPFDALKSIAITETQIGVVDLRRTGDHAAARRLHEPRM